MKPLRIHNIPADKVNSEILRAQNRERNLGARRHVAAQENYLRYLAAKDSEQLHLYPNGPPASPSEIAAIHESFIQKEERYRGVYVAELDSKSFYLRYEPDQDGGTGPFSSLEDAISWFMAGGR